MSPRITYLMISVVCFLAGSGISYLLLSLSEPPQIPEVMNQRVDQTIKQVERSTSSAEPASDNGAEKFFRLYGDERMRDGHQWIRRTSTSDLAGRVMEFANQFGKSRINTFYIAKPESDSEFQDEYVYVYWKEDNGVLILYPPYNVEDVTYYSWVYSMRRIDLKEDVVATEKEVGTSNNLVTRDWVKEILKKCVHGTKVVIDATKSRN